MNRTGEKGTLITYEKALFIQADLRIVRRSTIERKQMSTKTTFKRIALVAVAALGLGVLSVAPSSAAGNVSLTVSNGTATQIAADSTTTKVNSDSTTAGSVTVSALLDNVGDTVTVGFNVKSLPAGASAGYVPLYYVDSTTPLANSTRIGNSLTSVIGVSAWTSAANGTSILSGTPVFALSRETSTVGNTGYVGAKFKLMPDTNTAQFPAGDYVYSVTVKAYSVGGTTPVTTTSDVTITVSKWSNSSVTVAAASSVAYLNAGTATSATADAVVTGVATASSDTVATIPVRTYNAAGGPAPESITATLTGTAGVICSGGVCGTSLVLAGTGTTNITVQANGVAGVATINVSTPSVTFAPKTVTFYAKSPKTITASVNNPTLLVGSNTKAVKATAVDSNGTAWTGQLYIMASAAADALIGGSATAPVACSYDSVKLVHYCPITTKAVGTASFVVADQSLALGTETAYAAAMSAATSSAVSVTVSNAAPATVKLAFDKASYQPFEKAYITVTVLDAAGKTLQGQTFANLLASGGIATTQGFGSSSDTLTASSITTSTDSSSTAPRTAGAYTYTVYMPAQGTVTISATGGTSLAAAGQVAVSASATISNSAVDAATDAANEATDAANAATDAALAAADAADAATAAAQDASDAVAALSATVATLVASLKAQITSLTNLVIKIQKKVKA